MRYVIYVLVLLFGSMPVLAAEIVSARFVGPTERYQHCVLGDCVEYEAVEAILADGRIVSLYLDTASVFEDITPRLVPIGEGGGTAILVVRSYLASGAALALLEMRDGSLQITAESASIGTANRWQNPVGVADFDGDGRVEIATVITPHIGGTLTLFERQGDMLVPDTQIHGFSNHQYGSAILDLHEIMDWNEDGTPDIVLPDATRQELKVVTFVSGTATVLAEHPLPVKLKGPVTATTSGIRYFLQNGQITHWQR